jgi:hypothetical protein
VFNRIQPGVGWLFGWLALALLLPVRAVILFGSGDPGRNTTAPTGELAGSGWQWQTDTGPCATAVGAHHAVSAHHLGLHPGSLLSFGALTYPVLTVTNAPGSDLELLELAGTLPSFAPLYAETNEIGRPLVVFGRGTRRGSPVLAPDGSGTLRGWGWAGGDGRLRWGTNVVSDTDTGTADNGFSGDVLVGTFGPDAGADTGTLSTGDSGGGVFVRDDDGQWQLAGVNYAVEGSFNTTTNGAGFSAALFDRTGFFEQDSHNAWVIDDQQPGHPETVFIATRISSYAAWLQDLIVRPVMGRPVLFSATSVIGPYTEHPAYAVDTAKHQITLFVPAGDQFYRLEGASHLGLPTRQGNLLTLPYE